MQNAIVIISLIMVNVWAENIKEKQTEIKFLENFLEIHNYSKAIANTCWGKDDNVELFKQFSKHAVSISIIQNFNPVLLNEYVVNRRILFILDTRCGNFVDILLKAVNYQFLRDPFVWIIFGKIEDLMADNVYIPFNNILYVAEKNHTSHFIIKSIYNYRENTSRYYITILGEWKSEIGFLYFDRIQITKDRLNLRRTHLRTSYVITSNDTLNHLWDYRHPNVDKLSKINLVLIHALGDWLNATNVDIWASHWGYINDTYVSSDGMSADLLADRADLAGTTSFVRKQVLSYIDYLVPTTHTYIRFIFRAPPLSHTTNVYTLVFSNTLWLIIITVTFICSIVIYLIVCCEINYKIVSGKVFFIDVVLLEIGTLCQTAFDLQFRSCAGRLALLFNVICLMFLYNAYTAKIVVLFQSTSESIKDLQSLYDSGMNIGAEITPYVYFYAIPTAQTNEYYRNLFYKNRIARKGYEQNYFTTDQGIEKVRTEFFALSAEVSMANSLIMERFNQREKSNVKVIESIFGNDQPYLCIQKDSVYKELVLVGKLFENGVHQREYLKFFMKNEEYNGRLTRYDSLGIVDCHFPILILISGIFISLFILLFEISYKNLLTAGNRKKNRIRPVFDNYLEYTE